MSDLEKAEARIRKLEAALRPFVSQRLHGGQMRLCEPVPDSIPDDHWYHPSVACNPTAGDFRRALALLATKEPDTL